jgi:hypothetical protein
MRSILHKLILAPAVMAATALATTSAMAETINVPFSFTAAGKNCPAGFYTVRHDSTGSFVALINEDSAQSFLWVLGPGTPNLADNSIILKFDESGQTHTLRSIQYRSMITPRMDKKASPKDHSLSRLSSGR